MTKVEKANNYKDNFNNLIENTPLIYNCDGELLKIKPEEIFLQCYDSHDNERKELPEYWFISQYGRLISMYNQKPKWLKPDRSRHTESFRWINSKENGKQKNITSSTLVFQAHPMDKFSDLIEALTYYGLFDC